MRMVIGAFEGYERESKELLSFIMINIRCANYFDEKVQLARTVRSRNRFKRMAIDADELNRMALSVLCFGMPRIEEDYRPATMKIFNDDQRVREIMENGFRNYKALNILDYKTLNGFLVFWRKNLSKSLIENAKLQGSKQLDKDEFLKTNSESHSQDYWQKILNIFLEVAEKYRLSPHSFMFLNMWIQSFSQRKPKEFYG